MKLETKLYINPLNSFNEPFYLGGILFSCHDDKKGRDVFAAGGRYDSLIRDFRPKINTIVFEERHAVGFGLAWEKLARMPAFKARKSGAYLGKNNIEVKELLDTGRCDILISSFDPCLLRTQGVFLLSDLWAHGMSAELSCDARSPEDLIRKYRGDNFSWIVILKQDGQAKIKSMARKDMADVDVSVDQVLSWLRSEIRERDSRAVKLRGAVVAALSSSYEGAGSMSGGAGPSKFDREGREQDVRILVAQTKSKKFNRKAVVEQAQAAAAIEVRSFLEGPIIAIETSDMVMELIRHTSLSEPESWRRAENSVTTTEKNYIREVHDMLLSSRDKCRRGEHVRGEAGGGGGSGTSEVGQSRHAFVYNFRSGTCIYYDLGS